MNRIFKLTEYAIKHEMDWDEAIHKGEIETVKECEDYETAVAEYALKGYSEDDYGVE